MTVLPLEGIRIVDLTTVLMGPFATRVLGQLGADVIKVENLEGDIGRRLVRGKTENMSPVFLNIGRGKRSIAIDLKAARGRQVLDRLLAVSHAVIHNFRPAPAARFGLDRHAVRSNHPSLVACNVVGYGSEGRFADRPAYDDIIQAASGLAYTQTTVYGQNAYMATGISDKVTGLYASTALAAALTHRARSGEGTYIEVPMFEASMDFNLVEHLSGKSYEPVFGQEFYPRTGSASRRPFQCEDGIMAVMVYDDAQWSGFLTRVGRADLLADPRFADFTTRTANTDFVYSELDQILKKNTIAHWSEVFLELDIPFAVVNSIDDLLVNNHLGDVDMFRRIEREGDGTIIEIRSPIIIEGEYTFSTRPAPLLGADTREVLAAAGYSAAEVEDLVESGAVGV